MKINYYKRKGINLNTIIINKTNLTHNINVIKNEVKSDDYTVIGVVKGNGYGLGLEEYSKILIENGIKILAVASPEEAIKLRKVNNEIDILNMSSVSIKEEIEQLVENNIIITIGSVRCAEIVNEIAKEDRVIRAHIKIDTGFGRYGFISQNEVIKTIKGLDKNIKIEGIFSHFSIAYYKNNEHTKTQYNRFMSVIKALEAENIDIRLKHICNSPAFLNYPEMRLNSARIGSAFLGRVDSQNKLDLIKIGELKSQVAEIKELPKDHYVGYLNTYKTKANTKVAIIPVGYKDGYNVTIKNDMFRFRDRLRDLKHAICNLFKIQKLIVEIEGTKYPVIGKIGMYHLTVDITNSDVKIGDSVYLNASPLYIDSGVRREYI